MQIHGFTKTTLLDFPGHMAATVFTGHCNFRCPFCHNGGLVLSPEKYPAISEDEILSHLKRRQGILTGVCISGGEPTLQKDLASFLAKIKELDYAVKLDTNGSHPTVIQTLVSQNLVDYIAMDIKAGLGNYSHVCGVASLDMDAIQASISYIINCGVPYEFRTTVVKELHSMKDFLQIGPMLSGCSSFFLQSYIESADVLQPGFHSYNKKELLVFAEALKPYIKQVSLRGMD